MKKICLFALVSLTLFFVSCASDYSNVRATADYYYKQGEKFAALMQIYGELSLDEELEFERIQREERDYINSLTSDEREAYYERIDELNNM